MLVRRAASHSLSGVCASMVLAARSWPGVPRQHPKLAHSSTALWHLQHAAPFSSNPGHVPLRAIPCSHEGVYILPPVNELHFFPRDGFCTWGTGSSLRRRNVCYAAADLSSLEKEESVRDTGSICTGATANKRRPGRGKKRRLDELCRDRFPQHSSGAINSWILQGKVLVAGQPVYKPGTPLPDTVSIHIIAETPKYVCRAGQKLEAALRHFQVAVSGAVALDAGISTGGFTDCLLQHGAAHVYGVDVGYGQVSERIRTDPRVTVMERTNLRLLQALPQLVDLVTLDLSFISILAVLPAVGAMMKPEARLVALVKPQFEAPREQVGEGGIIRDPRVHDMVLARVIAGVEAAGFVSQGWIPSPVKGSEGNTEFLAYFHRKEPQSEPETDL